MVYVIPKFVRVVEPTRFRLRKKISIECCDQAQTIDVTWGMYGAVPDKNFIFKLENADELQAAGVNFVINDSPDPEVWDASKDFERWEPMGSVNPQGHQRRKNDPAKCKAPGALAERR